VGVESW